MDLKNYLKAHPKTHLIFDLDETILHLILPWEKVHLEIKNELIKLDAKAYQNYQNGKINLSQLENTLVLKHGKKVKDMLIKSRAQFETKYLKDVIPNPELITFIKKAKSYKLYLWSSNSAGAVKKALKQFKIDKYFEKIVTGTDVLLLKPEIDGFLKIYDPKVPKSQYLFIGDNESDKKAAQKAGIDCYLTTYFH